VRILDYSSDFVRACRCVCAVFSKLPYLNDPSLFGAGHCLYGNRVAALHELQNFGSRRTFTIVMDPQMLQRILNSEFPPLLEKFSSEISLVCFRMFPLSLITQTLRFEKSTPEDKNRLFSFSGVLFPKRTLCVICDNGHSPKTHHWYLACDFIVEEF
jgi:hypothetical protein